jgi:hypothetical protein
MKKLILLFVAAIALTSCSIEDDGPRIAYQFAEVTAADLPASFEKGKTYKVDVTYLLPSACHTAAGLEVKRGNDSGDQRRDIYVVGIGRYDANLGECTREEDELEREASFSILIDEDEPYTFYLWSGVDDNMESQYTVVEVPVMEQEITDGN